MFEDYEIYLDSLGKLLQKYFDKQKDYIKCHEGCSFCCESGQYPFTKLEFDYAMQGYNALSEEEKTLIKCKIEKLKSVQTPVSELMYECPFLIDKRCSIYSHRGIICRSHGLIYFIDGQDDIKMPYCANLGLNYSNVYDKDRNTISMELCKKTGIEQMPSAYNVSLAVLSDNNLTKKLNLDLKEKKSLIEWFD